MKFTDFNELEMISNINIYYRKDIEEYLVHKSGKIKQEDFSACVEKIFENYKKIKSHPSIMYLIKQKYISMNDIFHY
jgi:hypothetical protein